MNEPHEKRRQRRLELSLVLDFGTEQHLGTDDEINEDVMRKKALDYAADAAQEGDFDVEIALIDEATENR